MHMLNTPWKSWWLCRHCLHLWMPWHKISSNHLQLARQHPLHEGRKAAQPSLWKFTELLWGRWLPPAIDYQRQTVFSTEAWTANTLWHLFSNLWGMVGKSPYCGHQREMDMSWPPGFFSSALLCFFFFFFKYFYFCLLGRNKSIKHNTKLQCRAQVVHACFKESRALGLAAQHWSQCSFHAITTVLFVFKLVAKSS